MRQSQSLICILLTVLSRTLRPWHDLAYWLLLLSRDSRETLWLMILILVSTLSKRVIPYLAIEQYLVDNGVNSWMYRSLAKWVCVLLQAKSDMECTYPCRHDLKMPGNGGTVAKYTWLQLSRTRPAHRLAHWYWLTHRPRILDPSVDEAASWTGCAVLDVLSPASGALA